MKSIDLNDTPNESSYLKRLLTREIERLEGWINNPGPHSKGANIMRFREDLATAQSILWKLNQ